MGGDRLTQFEHFVLVYGLRIILYSSYFYGGETYTVLKHRIVLEKPFTQLRLLCFLFFGERHTQL